MRRRTSHVCNIFFVAPVVCSNYTDNRIGKEKKKYDQRINTGASQTQ